MNIGPINLKLKTSQQFWESYLRVMQSVLPHSQQLTNKELEILSLSIAEAIKEDRDVFDPIMVKLLAARLQVTEFVIRMHRKNIRNKGWVRGNALEAFTAKVAADNPNEITVQIKLSR